MALRKSFIKKAKKIQKEEKVLEKKMLKTLKKNVKKRKGKYATKRDQELMFGY